jgi:glycosyltransferase involved in cell wall biosynthesis
MGAMKPTLAGEMAQGEVSNLPAASSGRRRKVFYLLDSLNIGGTETQAVELAVRMPTSGYEITLGCLTARGPLLERLKGSDVRIEEFHPKGGLDSPTGFYEMLRLAAYLRRERFDVVHAHDLWSNLMGVPAARLARVPAIISSQRDLSHFDWYRGMKRKALRTIQRMSNVLLANATPIRDALIAEDRFPSAKLRVVHNGVDTTRFQRGRRDREHLFPGPDRGKLVVLVGNMHSDVKGHPWLIEAAPNVLKEFPDTRFILAGDGEARKDFERQVRDSGLAASFVFLGARRDVPDILASCDIGVLPSKAEGLSNAVLEYMAAGLPTIVSRVGGNPELVQDGVTGLLIPPQDSPALEAALLRLLRDENFARRLAEAGRRVATQDYSFERLVRDVDALYTELLAGTKRN